MKFLNEIPDNFQELAEADLVGDTENMTVSDLKQIDNQLKQYGLELIYFENGAAINWIIEKI